MRRLSKLTYDEIAQRIYRSFVIGRASVAGPSGVADTEVEALELWAGDAIGRVEMIEAVVTGELVIELDGQEPMVRVPTAAEAARLNAAGLR